LLRSINDRQTSANVLQMLFISAGSSRAILRESQLKRRSTHVLYDKARHIKKRIIMTYYFIKTVNVTLYQYDWLHCLKQVPSPHHPLLVTSAKYPISSQKNKKKQLVRG